MRTSNFDVEGNESHESSVHKRDNTSGVIIMETISTPINDAHTSESGSTPTNRVFSIRLDTVGRPTSAERNMTVKRNFSLRNVEDEPAFSNVLRRSNTDFSLQSKSGLSLSPNAFRIKLETFDQESKISSEDDADHTEESGPIPQPLTLFFVLRVLTRLVTRIGDMGTDIWVLHTAYVTAGQEDFFLWLLCFQFLPIPLLLIHRLTTNDSVLSFLRALLMDLLHLSQLKELIRSLQLGTYTDAFVMIHSTEALLTGFPEAVLQYLVVLKLEEEGTGWTTNKIILLVSTFFSAISVGNSMYGFESQIHDIQDMKNFEKSDCQKYLETSLLNLYFAMDMVMNLFIVALCLHFYIPFGCAILTWRYFYRSMLNFAVYYDRGAIWRNKKDVWEEDKKQEKTHSCSAMLVFAFFAAGPIQLLTDLPFNHDLAFKGGEWLFALHFGAVLDLAAVLSVGYFVDNIVDSYLFLSCVVLQVFKGVIDLTVYVPMLLADNTAEIVGTVEQNIQRRLSRLVQPRTNNDMLRERSHSLPPMRNFTGFNL